MKTLNRKEPFLLLVGDIVSFYAGLWLMLVLRYGQLPHKEFFNLHVLPFSILFIIWISVFFIAGLYEKHTLLLKGKIGSVILKAQITNSVLAVLFFYFIPLFGIAPKTNLFMSLITSFAFVMFWRIKLFPMFEVRIKERAMILGVGGELQEIEREVNNNSRYDLQIVFSDNLDSSDSDKVKDEILQKIYTNDVSLVVIDFKNDKVEPILSSLYKLIFSDVKFVDIHAMYEDIFDRIPLSMVRYSWFLEHISGSTQRGYDFLKRVMDILVSMILGIISLMIYPFVYIAIKLEDGGPIFFTQERIGQHNSLITLKKFRSLKVHNDPEGLAKNPTVTKVGAFIRKSRIDELPQLWSVLLGDLSLIGPRPEVPALVRVYEKEIPYYNVRHLIKPGLSGWAQLYGEHAHKESDVLKTKNKLSYDLYYIKNRSILLDCKVLLRTIMTVLSREGV